MKDFLNRCVLILPAAIVAFIIELVPEDLISLEFQSYIFWSATFISFSIIFYGLFSWWAESRNNKDCEFNNPNKSNANKVVDER
ncbi:MAG: undecaprenyl pyrophosphate phosphatase UppP [Colwellia sp.]|jgi:hypothetical protein